MKPFAAQILEDNAAAFVNGYEFADEHSLNGVTCLAITQNITATEVLSENSNAARDDFVIFGARLMVNVLRSSLCGEGDSVSKPPVPGQLFDVDGKQYLVESCADDLGILSIILVANDR